MIYNAPRGGREATPHWKAAREGKLLLPFNADDAPVWPPTDAPLRWRECGRGGHVLAFSIIRRPLTPEWKERVPYCVAMVEVESGHRLFSNIVDCDVDTIQPGLPVTAGFAETTDPELGIVIFRPASAVATR